MTHLFFKTRPKIGQIWKSKRGEMVVIITGKSKDKWRTKILTEKPGVYNGSHTLSRMSLYKNFIFLE